MKRNHLDFDVYKKQVLKDPKLKAEYDRLQPEFAFIDAMIKSRTKYGLTQKALAKKIGTKQSVISRLEIGRANPTFSFLKRLAKALNSNLEIHFIPS
ncbi:transcriptional regulator [Candidatus Roizmanbacteria bacterium CG_4_10_14_0_2_um_filter_36_35]|uniref:Transcriptional regulator n=4 Tax=Candidatus Roizmaniibacteriota TaxID=1752723 RepID=A0A2M7BWY8_9BACT|nr:MAG: transcriptional regulator [Candidatus Roizmanbacteria bacterium CG11_big_fil_rev_8_21_14_0_20_35_14]PIV11078.1 MAG: transcriptional regulator [Candidatus Roizmanbacteria bacterium CG03_land_8_20_14_0_80_35_26]PIZ67891.1 MAG: transcriptional regulator [Candidatus Roizmanbacteria bacterium CG_4_10_14_0_2_um_filter_36_35]PJC32803.1 MAG: transcriptional regulator [Candidatus Roizmanbacteria bacterium CG_4_9_14_0_2_um_filter_36_12]PJC81001.1 MAG: transcriptional regulator [Candidatus Roizman